MTTITIHENLDLPQEFQNLLEFLQSIDIAEVLDFQEESIDKLSNHAKASLEELEDKGTTDCLNS